MKEVRLRKKELFFPKYPSDVALACLVRSRDYVKLKQFLVMEKINITLAGYIYKKNNI